MPNKNSTKLLRTSLLTLGLLGILHSNIQAGEIEQKAFIERLYQNILNRSSDTTGMNTWMNTIQNQSATQVAMGFLNSQELANKNLSNEEYLDILYQTLFDRQADSGGRNDWLEKMRNGRTKQSVMFGFFQSDEFKNLANKFGVTQILSTDNPSLTGVESYVDRFYRLVLKRNYDENGFNDWVNQLTNKTKNPTEIANGFLFSPEYVKQNEDNSTYLDTCYQAFFGRASDEGGKSDWLNKINQGYTRQQIFEGFTGSQEFKNLVDSFKLDSVDNDAPSITSATTFTVNENQTNGFTITSTDDSTVTYFISGTDSSLFNVNATTGVVTFKTNPDFETKSSYSLTVRAMDASNNVSSKDVTLNIADVVEDYTLPTYQKEITRQGYVNLIFMKDTEYVPSAVSFLIDSTINSTSNWIYYEIKALNFVNGAANPKDTVILLKEGGYLSNGAKVPRKVVCSYSKTKTESPKEYDLQCNAIDNNENIISSKLTHIIGDNLDISMNLKYRTSNNYYLVNAPSFSTGLE